MAATVPYVPGTLTELVPIRRRGASTARSNVNTKTNTDSDSLSVQLR